MHSVDNPVIKWQNCAQHWARVSLEKERKSTVLYFSPIIIIIIILLLFMISIRTNLLWRPGIALGVTQRQPAFKLIKWHAKSRTTKSIPGLYIKKKSYNFCDQCYHSLDLKCFYQIPLTWWKTYEAGYDCITIPGAVKNTVNMNAVPERICGRKLVTVGGNTVVSVTVCSK